MNDDECRRSHRSPPGAEVMILRRRERSRRASGRDARHPSAGGPGSGDSLGSGDGFESLARVVALATGQTVRWSE